MVRSTEIRLGALMFLVTTGRPRWRVTLIIDLMTRMFPSWPRRPTLTSPTLSPTVLMPALPSTPSEEQLSLKLLTTIEKFPWRRFRTAPLIREVPLVSTALATLVSRSPGLSRHPLIRPEKTRGMLRPMTLIIEMPIDIGIRPSLSLRYPRRAP